MSKTVLNVMTDYGWAFLWQTNDTCRGVGGNIADGGGFYEELPLSEPLWQKFSEWSRKFENTYFYQYDEDSEVDAVKEEVQLKPIAWDSKGQPVEWDWDAFHQEGIELSKLLRQELDDGYIVRYVKPYEDFITQGYDRSEITLKGEIIPLIYSRELDKFIPVSV